MLKIICFLIIIIPIKCINNLYQNTGIITIATGGYNANNLIYSLRNIGKWRKNIYIYSDPCTPRINNTISIDLPKITDSPLESKSFKMDILKNTTEDYILFLDSDIKVDRSINNFFKKIKKWNESCDAYMPHDIWYSKKFIFNSGIIFVKRNRSEYFLDYWQKIILDKNYKGNKDQPGLKMIIDKDIINMCLIPDELVYYLPDTTSKIKGITTSVFKHYLKYKNNFQEC